MGKLEGIHYVKPLGEGLTTGGQRKKRKPTLAELESLWRITEANFDRAQESRHRKGFPPLEPNFYTEALGEELAARRSAGPQVNGSRQPTAAQVRSIAEAALQRVGQKMPRTRDGAEVLLETLGAS